MSDLIKDDIEKIERALNICLDDIQFESTFNSIELNKNNLNENQYSIFKFFKEINFNYQKYLFQLSNHFQSLEFLNKSNELINPINEINLSEFENNSISNKLKISNDSIQFIRRIIQREEKSRLSSNETIEKLIEIISNSIRQEKINKLFEKIETSKEDKNLINNEILRLKNLNNKELIKEEYENNSIDLTLIRHLLINNFNKEKINDKIWSNLIIPTIYSEKEWSNQDEHLLNNLIKTYGINYNSWLFISSHFKNRSPFICANYFMNKQNSHLNKTKFTKEEKIRLKELIEETRIGNYIPLNKIAYEMGYNLSKIRREWRNLNPNVRKGQWTKEEDKILLESVSKQSNRIKIDWNLVSNDVIGRSKTKCYQRFIHLNKFNINKKNFQLNEDLLLIEKHSSFKGRWSEIEKYFPNRTLNQLQNRWKKLNEFKKINDLFYSQQENIQLFLLKEYSSNKNLNNKINFYEKPNIKLNFKQLKYLTSNLLFKDFCSQIDLNQIKKNIKLNDFIKKLSTFNNIQQIKDLFFL